MAILLQGQGLRGRTLGLRRRPKEHFAHKGRGRLGHQHGDYLGYVAGLDQAGAILRTSCAAKGRVDGARSYDRYTHVILPQFLRDRIREPVKSPLGGGIGGPVGEDILSRERRDVEIWPDRAAIIMGASDRIIR